jgi:hypothetical protein
MENKNGERPGMDRLPGTEENPFKAFKEGGLK